MGEDAVLHAGEEHRVELEPLRGVQRHQGDDARALVRNLVGVCDESDPLEERGQGVVRLGRAHELLALFVADGHVHRVRQRHELGSDVHELVEVLDPGRILRVGRGGQGVDDPRVEQDALEHLVGRRTLGDEVAVPRHHRREGRQLRHRSVLQPVDLSSPVQRLAERDPPRDGELLDSRLRGVSDATFGLVEDASYGDVVGLVGDRAQVGDRVTDLLALVEADTADHPVGQADPDEHLLERPRLCVRPVEDGRVAVRRGARVSQPVDLRRDELGLGLIRVGDVADEQRPVTGFGPQPLGWTVRVARDDGVRGAEHVARRAVVLLQQDGARSGKVLLEVEDVADRRPAERVDRLVRVAHDHELRGLDAHRLAAVRDLAAQLAHEHVLRVVRVLVLVDQHVPEPPPIGLADVGERLEQVDGRHDEVVEVQCLRRGEASLVRRVRLRVRLLHRTDRVLLGGLVVDEVVLLIGDPVEQCSRREALGIDVQLVRNHRHEPLRVGVVVDRERAFEPEVVDLLAQDPYARRVERRHPHQLGPSTDELADPGPHLGGRLVRERDREDRAGMDVALRDQMRDTARQHPRLARPRAGDDEDRRACVQYRLALRRVQPLQQVDAPTGLLRALRGRARLVGRHDRRLRRGNHGRVVEAEQIGKQ